MDLVKTAFKKGLRPNAEKKEIGGKNMTLETVKEITPDIVEVDAIPTDPLVEVLRSWRIKTGNRPLTVSRVGQTLRLTKASAIEALYLGRIRLLELPEEGVYRCIQPFRHVNLQGEYEAITPKTRVILSASEAHEHLKRNNVRPCFDTSIFGRYIEE